MKRLKRRVQRSLREGDDKILQKKFCNINSNLIKAEKSINNSYGAKILQIVYEVRIQKEALKN